MCTTIVVQYIAPKVHMSNLSPNEAEMAERLRRRVANPVPFGVPGFKSQSQRSFLTKQTVMFYLLGV